MSTADVEVRQLLSGIVDGELIMSIADEDLVFQQGVIDSLHLIELIDAFETHFGIEVAPEELSPENFGSIGAMARYVSSKRTP